MKKEIRSRWIFVLARALDHRIGRTDDDRPDLPILTLEEAMASVYLRLFSDPERYNMHISDIEHHISLVSSRMHKNAVTNVGLCVFHEYP